MIEFLSRSVYFGVGISLVCYELGLLLKRKYKLAILNPLLIATLCVIGVLLVLGVEYEDFNAGAKYLTYFLTPATVALAIPLYEQLTVLRRNLPAVLGGIVAGTLAGLTGIFLMSRLFGLSHELYASFLPKSITTAIGMGVSQEIGGVVSLTVASIVITGILGNVIGEGFLKLLRVREPVARGLAMGTSAHAIGTARALEMGAVEGAMSGLSIAVAGLITVVAAPVFANLL